MGRRAEDFRSLNFREMKPSHGSDFGSLFIQWASITTKPMVIGEFGIDAFHATALSNPNPPGVDSSVSWDGAVTLGLGTLVLVLALGLGLGYIRQPRISGL